MTRAVSAVCLIAGGLLLCGVSARAGTIGRELEEAIVDRSPADSVDVIVRFARRVDVQAHRFGDLRSRRDRLIRALRSNADRERRAIARRLVEHGAQNVRSLWLINAIALRLPAARVASLAADPAIESVSLDATIELPVAAPAGSAGAASSESPEWNIAAIGAPALWAQGLDGAGVVVASMDSGVDAAHPDLAATWRGGSNSWLDPYGQHASPHDANGHGTWSTALAVGAAAGGTAIGVAPGAQWIAAKIFRDNGQATLSGIHQSYQWLLDPDGNPASDDAPDVVNNSWYLESTVNQCNTEFAADLAALDVAGIAVVFAAGNSGPGPATSLSPANDPHSLAVGAVDAFSIVAGFSSRGPSACGSSPYPTVSAPGVDVRTADLTLGGVFPDSYVTVSGTSFAASHVSGAIALLLCAFPDASVAQLRAALATGADDLAPPGPDSASGAGLIDLVESHAILLAQAPGPGALSLRYESESQAEGAGTVQIAVQRTGGSLGSVGADYEMIAGTAMPGSDYVSTTGQLAFSDGETLQTIALTVLDDAVFEGDETLTIVLSSPTGGATLGAPDAEVVTISEDEPPPPADTDQDGYPVGVDCNDLNAAIHPGATEVKHDFIDQDCNGFDLTIELIRAPYSVRLDKLEVQATSGRGSQAGLSVRVVLQSGASFVSPLTWNTKLRYWQRMIDAPEQIYGSEPVSVEISGGEGMELFPVLRR